MSKLKNLTPSDAQHAIARTDAALTDARDSHRQAAEKVETLNAIIDRAREANAAVQRVVAEDGAAGLAALAAGGAQNTELNGMISQAETASRAAKVAADALPKAEAAAQIAANAIVALEEARRQHILAAAVERADLVAQEYRQAFQRLGALHDELRGIAQGLAVNGFRGSITMANTVLEVPRFNLPSLQCSGGYTPFLNHVPDDKVIRHASRTWSGLVKHLSANPLADTTTLAGFEDLTPEVADPRSRREIVIHERRHGADEDILAAQPDFGGAIRPLVSTDVELLEAERAKGAAR